MTEMMNIWISESEEESQSNISINLPWYQNKKTNQEMGKMFEESDEQMCIWTEKDTRTEFSCDEAFDSDDINDLEFLLDEELEDQKYCPENTERILESSSNDDKENIEFAEMNFQERNDSNSFFEIEKNENSLFKTENTHWSLQRSRNPVPFSRMKIETMKRSFSLPNQKIPNIQSSGDDFWKYVDNGVKFSLPITKIGASDSLPRIQCHSLSKTLSENKNIQIIDCRFDYEYEGGHIKNAVNIETTDMLINRIEKFRNKILVFYCEFSSVRAPRIAKYLRSHDRFNNEYPKLDFPEIYILEGGYKNFYSHYSSLCDPENYIKMKP